MLVGDVTILARGEGMVHEFRRSLEYTHEYLADMGAKMAPDKSHNFANTKEAK